MLLVSHLMNLLLSELEVQDELLGLLIRERVALIKHSQNEMEAILLDRSRLEERLDRFAERRENLFRALEGELRLNPGQISLHNLECVESGELSLLGESLAGAFETIFEMREQNRILRRQSVSVVG